jgi:hypothetical protein
LSRPTSVSKQVEQISHYFTTSPGGRAGGLLEKPTIRLTQPSLAGTGAELGKKERREKVNDYSCTIVSERHQWRTHTLGPKEEEKKSMIIVVPSSDRLTA